MMNSHRKSLVNRSFTCVAQCTVYSLLYSFEHNPMNVTIVMKKVGQKVVQLVTQWS